jgi:hypothetical protein
VAMMHTNLVNHYERLFAFKQYHQWNISEIEELMPWEFDVMTSLLSNYMEAMKVRKNQKQATQNG